MSEKLFAVYLGGRAPKCNIELHDVVFAVGESIEATYHQLMTKWFGTPKGLHIDSWLELDVVDGHRVRLTKSKTGLGKKLFFVNLGGYQPGLFSELHANAFIIANDETEVKKLAKERLLKGMNSVHTDDLYDVDDCLEIQDIDGFYIFLEPTSDNQLLKPNNGYHIVPKPIVEEYMRSQGLTDNMSSERNFNRARSSKN